MNKCLKMTVMAIVLFVFVGAVSAEEITLDKSIDYALTHNQSVLIAKEKVKASEGATRTASSYLWPQLSATGGYTRASYLTNLAYGDATKLPVFNMTGLPTGDYIPFPSFSFSADREGDIYTGKLNLQYVLYSFGKFQATSELYYLNELSSREEHNKTLSDIKLSVKQAFYSVLLAQEFIKVLEETNKSLSLHLETSKKRYDSGLSSKFDVLRAQVQLSNIQPQLTKAKNQLAVFLINFNTVLGADKNDKFVPVGELKYEKEDFLLEDCLKSAYEKRYELKQMKLRKQVAEKSVTISYSYWFPSIVLAGGYQATRGQQFPPNDTKWYTGWDAGLAISIPIFDGFGASGRVQEASSNLEQARVANEQFEKFLDMEVRTAYLTLKSSEDTILAQKENVEVANESFRIIKERYKEGQATNLEVLDTEVSLLQAQTNYLQTLFDYTISKEKLKKAMGRE